MLTFYLRDLNLLWGLEWSNKSLLMTTVSIFWILIWHSSGAYYSEGGCCILFEKHTALKGFIMNTQKSGLKITACFLETYLGFYN